MEAICAGEGHAGGAGDRLPAYPADSARSQADAAARMSGSQLGESIMPTYRACRSVAVWSMFTPSLIILDFLNAENAEPQ